MMKIAAFLLGAVLFWPSSAVAQQNDAILEALKRIEGRIDGMQKQIDDLKGASSRQVPAPSGNQGTAALPAGTRAVAGWAISVLPYSRDALPPDALFRFPASKTPLRFDAHLATRRIDNWVSYRGEAKLNVTVPGRYVINFDLIAPPNRMYCWLNMNIGKYSIIDLKDRKDIEIKGSTKLTMSGGADLEVGSYDAAFRIGCVNGHARGYLGGVSFGDLSLQEWRQMTFDIQVRSPTDDVPRAFTASELFHLVRQTTGDQSRNAPERSAAAAQLKSASGVRTLLREVNVRSAPTTVSGIVRKLQPGQQVKLVGVTTDNQWHQIAIGAEVLGFVYSRTLLGNSQ